jgi:arylsulfatase A-like enzyme
MPSSDLDQARPELRNPGRISRGTGRKAGSAKPAVGSWSRRRLLRLLLWIELAACALLAVTGPAQAATRPNIIVIQTDDQNARTVKETFRKAEGGKALIMPNTVREIFRGGTEFRNYYATTPLCSPSRASLLTGDYPHNTGVLRNGDDVSGWQEWQDSPGYADNLPVALQQAGYRTSHFGKLINGYYDKVNDSVETTVPPGWDRWFTTSIASGLYFYGYQVNDDGLVRTDFGSPLYGIRRGSDPKRCDVKSLIRPILATGCNYLTDKVTREAVKEIRRNAGRPLYMQVDYEAPHGDSRQPAGPLPATRHIDSLNQTWLSRPPNFNEADNSDKSSLIQGRTTPRMDSLETESLRNMYRYYGASLRSVDDGIGAIISALEQTDELDNTYIFYLSDNGYFLGEHRFSKAKFLPYDASSRIAMAVRGPDVLPGRRSSELVGNVDVAPTALELAGLTPDGGIDGRSLIPYWNDTSLRSRRPVGLALRPTPPPVPGSGATVSAEAPALEFDGFMVGPYKYFRYESGGEAELYDMKNDPWELENVIDSPEYVQVRQYMEAWLPRVSGCAGEVCRSELPPWPKPAPAAPMPQP